MIQVVYAFLKNPCTSSRGESALISLRQGALSERAAPSLASRAIQAAEIRRAVGENVGPYRSSPKQFVTNYLERRTGQGIRVHFLWKLITRGKSEEGPSSRGSSWPLRYLLKKERM